MNLTDFGLPQNRERIIFVASKNKSFDFNFNEKIKIFATKKILNIDGEFDYLKKSEYSFIPKHLVQHKTASGLIFVGFRNKKGFQRGIRKIQLI